MILLEDKQREIVPFGLRELSIWAFWYFWVFVACALYFPFLVLFSWPHILRHHYMFVVFTATLGLDLFLKEFSFFTQFFILSSTKKLRRSQSGRLKWLLEFFIISFGYVCFSEATSPIFGPGL